MGALVRLGLYHETQANGIKLNSTPEGIIINNETDLLIRLELRVYDPNDQQVNVSPELPKVMCDTLVCTRTQKTYMEVDVKPHSAMQANHIKEVWVNSWHYILKFYDRNNGKNVAKFKAWCDGVLPRSHIEWLSPDVETGDISAQRLQSWPFSSSYVAGTQAASSAVPAVPAPAATDPMASKGSSGEGAAKGQGSAVEAAINERLFERYTVAPKQIRFGTAADAAHGIKTLLGLSDLQVATFLQEKEVAIQREFETHGSPEDRENLRCVLAGTKRFEWESGISLEALMAHEHARIAKLLRHHILALRLYSTSSFPHINDPLRSDPVQRPHPFAATTYFVSEGIKLLRAVAASLPDAYMERIYWRGMRDLGIQAQFLAEGGTDFACVSTTAAQQVAVHNFALSALPLVLKVVSKTCIDRGADISFLSVYPSEKEFLYPPLTYLRGIKMESETLCGVQLLVVTVQPTMA